MQPFDKSEFNYALNKIISSEGKRINSIIVAYSNMEILKSLATWESASFPQFHIEVPDYPGDDAQEDVLWDWMWECVEFDAEEFMSIANVGILSRSRIMKILMRLKMIYPDGSVPKAVSDLLKAKIEEIKNADKHEMF